jgi:type I restriction enzyme S subunit
MEVTDIQYKESEIGVIPIDWEVKPLEELCRKKGLVRGPFGGALKKEFFVRDGIKVYEQQNAIYRDFSLGDYFIDLKKFEELSRFEVKPNDFIVSCSGTIGRIFMIPINAPKGIINQALLKITIDESIVKKQFFLHYFEWDEFQLKIIDSTQGGAMKNLVGMAIFRDTKFAVPSKSEQTAIATALSDTDALIENLEKLIAKKRNIKQGVMQELLKPESNWILTSVGEVATIRKGEQLNKDTLTAQGQYPVMNGGIQPSGYTDKWNQNPNTIIISEGGNSCGYVNFIKTRFWQGGHCYSVDAKIHKHFLYHLLKFHEKEIMGLRVGSGLPNIQRNRLIEFSLSIPDREKQHAIALVLDEINEVITAMENKLQKYKMVKQGMMQALLTGKIRLA